MIKLLLTYLRGIPTKDEGGPSRIIHDLLNGLSSSKYDTSYFSSTHKSLQTGYKEYPDSIRSSIRKRLGEHAYRYIPLYKKLVTSPFYLRYYYKRVEKSFRSFSDQCKYDIIHAHDPISLNYFVANNAKNILTMHFKGGMINEMTEKGYLDNLYQDDIVKLRTLEIESFQKADVITFPSIAAKSLFIATNNVKYDESKIRIIYNGVDIEHINNVQLSGQELTKHGMSETQKYILNIAHHSKQKNILGLLKTIKLIKEKYDEKIVLLNIGFGPETKMYLEFVRQNDLARNVYFIGKMKNDEVLRMLKRCECFVLTSYNVVFDLVVLEALACGIPVFVSNDGGNKEIIQDGFNGYLIDQHNEDSIANALMTFDRTRVRHNARKSVQQYSLKTMISNYEKAYEEVIRKP